MGPRYGLKLQAMLEGCGPNPYLRYVTTGRAIFSFMPRRPWHVFLIAMALPALLLSLCYTATNEDLVSRADSDLIVRGMVVKFTCLACEQRNGTPNFFTSFRAAQVHYSRSSLCNMSPRGIATVVLPNRPTDNEAGGSGAAGQWGGQRRVHRRLPQQRQGMGLSSDMM